MPPTPPNAYLKTKVLTAAPEELRLMLFDGALRFARLGRQGIADNDHEKTFEGISRCQAIVLELINSLRPEHDPDLCAKLSSLYTFLYTRLIEASRQHDAALVDEVIKLLTYERETWVLLMERLAQQNGKATSVAGDSFPPRSISVQG